MISRNWLQKFPSVQCHYNINQRAVDVFFHILFLHIFVEINRSSKNFNEVAYLLMQSLMSGDKMSEMQLNSFLTTILQASPVHQHRAHGFVSSEKRHNYSMQHFKRF